MAGLPTIQWEFRLGGDPELRFTPSGKAVANFSGVCNKRVKKDNGEWEDGPPTWLRFDVWGKAAENVAESLVKGALVFITGELECRDYETREGEKRQSWEVHVESIGPSLKWDAARILKAERSGGQSNAGQGSQASGQAAAGQENQDPWAAPPSDEPPF
jgi:single-strand DNA-binding protein